MTDKEITQLWNEYYPKVFGYFYRRLSNRQDVEDLTSISLTSFLNKLIEDQDSISNQNAYLWRICHNQLTMLIKSKSKNPALVPYDENWVPQDTSLELHICGEFTNRMKSLKQCITKHISPEDATIIELSYFEDLTSSQIAQKLSLNPPTVRKRLSRAIEKIRTICTDLWFNYS